MPDVARAKRIDPIQTSATSAGLAGGSETVAAYTVPAGRQDTVVSASVLYTGIAGGVTLQLLVNGVGVGVPVEPDLDGVSYDLLQGNRPVADSGDQVAIQVENGVAADTISYQIHSLGARA